MSTGVLSPPREILTHDEWRARGRARRERVSLEEHAYRDGPSDRPDPVSPKRAVQRRRGEIRKAQRRTSLKAMTKFCDQVGGEHRIRPDHPVIVRFPIGRNPEMLNELRSAVALSQETLPAGRREVLRRYDFGDLARKVVGVGSVGTEAFVLLLMGDRDDEPPFLQIKKARESVLAPFFRPGEYEHEGERVARGQRTIQAATDEFLGWTSGVRTTGAASKDYYVRPLRDIPNPQPRLTGPLLPRARAPARAAVARAGHGGVDEPSTTLFGGRRAIDHMEPQPPGRC